MYRFIEDPGHGWLEVPKAELAEVGVADKITEYSYINGDKVYLEEDCDAPCFIKAYCAKNGITEGQFRKLIINFVYRERHAIRSFDYYKGGGR